MGKRLQSSDHIRTAFRLAEDGKYRIAERKQRQALRAARRTGGRDLVWALYAAGVFFRKHKRLENAIQALSECWELASQAQFDDAIEIAENSASLRAMCCADNGDLGTAKSWYLRARSAAEAGGKCANIARLDLLLAAYDVQLKNVKSAVKRYEQALLCDEIEPQHRRMAEELLVILYGRRKQPEKREALRAKLIQQSIGDFISQPRTAKVPDKMAHPAGFGTDTLSDFLFAAEMSTLATYEQKESLFRRLVEKDAHFRVMGRAVMNFVSNQFNKQYPQLAVHEIQPTDADWLEVYFFQQCHSSYLAVFVSLQADKTLRLRWFCEAAWKTQCMRIWSSVDRKTSMYGSIGRQSLKPSATDLQLRKFGSRWIIMIPNCASELSHCTTVPSMKAHIRTSTQ